MFRRQFSLAIVVASLLVAAMSAPTASAHEQCVLKETSGGTDLAKACNRVSAYSDGYPHWNHYLDACDMNADGNLARAWGYWNPFDNSMSTDWDSNGPAAGCANIMFTNLTLAKHKICVQVAGCSQLVYH